MSQPSSENAGPPRWTGKKFEAFKIEGYLIPWSPVSEQPLLVQIHGCEDFFLPIFSDEDKLHAHMEYLHSKGMLPCPVTVDSLAPNVLQVLGHRPYKIKQVDAGGQTDFLESVFEAGVRIMVDPRIISDNHTKWTEVVFDGDEYKLMFE